MLQKETGTGAHDVMGIFGHLMFTICV